MLRIALCDDEATELNQILDLLSAYRTEQNAEIECTAYRSPIELLAAVDRGQQYDVLLLDVVMPGMNGIEAAHEIRHKDASVKIIFLTSSPEFALESYEVGAYFYQLKPVGRETLFRLIAQVTRELECREKDSIILKCTTGIVRIPLERIEYCESIKKACRVVLAGDERLECRSTLQEIAGRLLLHEGFLRPHRSYLVNMRYVYNLSYKGIEMENGVSIPLPHGTFAEIKEEFLRYAFRKERCGFDG